MCYAKPYSRSILFITRHFFEAMTYKIIFYTACSQHSFSQSWPCALKTWSSRISNPKALRHSHFLATIWNKLKMSITRFRCSLCTFRWTEIASTYTYKKLSSFIDFEGMFYMQFHSAPVRKFDAFPFPALTSSYLHTFIRSKFYSCHAW